MKEFYIPYQTMHNDVIAACSCIASNPCSELQGEFEEIKNTISGLSLQDEWQDSVGDAFSEVKNSCTTALNTIISSISSSFVSSEQIYKELKINLDNLKTENTNYQNKYKEKPDAKSSKYYDSNKKDYDNSKFQKDYDEWKREVESLETKCQTLQNQINQQKASLDSINGNTISTSLTASLPEIADKVSEIFMSATLTSILGNIDISQFLTTMTFNGQTYQVIDTSKSYQAILAEIGKQNPDGCYDYSAAYLDAIFNYSSAFSKSGVATNQNLIATQDEQTALQAMAKELLEGRPCIIRVNGKTSTGTRHFVLVTGLNKNADLNNLKQSDFMIMDPASATLKVLDTDIGGQRRYLLKTENDEGWAGREGDTQGYLIALANKDTEYIKYEGIEQGVAPHVNYNPANTTGTQKKAELAERAKQAGVTIKPTTVQTAGTSTVSQTTSYTPVLGKDTETTVYTILKQNGYSDAGIAAVMGNIEQECTFNINAVGDGGYSHGLCQWNDSPKAGKRWTKLVNWCNQNGYNPNSAKGQTEYLVHELEQDYSGLNSRLKTSDDYSSLAKEFCRSFERPAKVNQRANERADYATKYYNNIKSQTPVKA